MSKQYEINHGLYIKDEFRESLSTELKTIYDQYNDFLGVDVKDLSKSEYVMPFYPVFPSWMATVGTIFGSDNRVYALTFFSILSVIGIYLLAYEISDRNKKVGLLASFLIAINPLHVYFSKLPVTEIVSLTFLCFSLYFLLRFYNEYKQKNIQVSDLIISLLFSSALFYTRMSGIFLFPIIIVIPVLALLFAKERGLFRYLLVYSGLWSLSLALSYVFYKVYLPELFDQIIGKKILSFIEWQTILILVLSLLVVLILIFYVKNIRDITRKILKFLSKYLPAIALLSFFLLIYYEFLLYIKGAFLDNGYSLFSNESLSLFKQQSFLVGFLYLSPIGFILLPLSFIYLRKKMDVKILLLISTILIFLIYCWGVLKITQYHYYFARYQLSELIPLCTILVSVFLVELCKRKISKIVSIGLISLMAIYFGYFSVIQLQDYEGADKGKFEEIQELVGRDGVLIVTKKEFFSFNQIIFPMKYYYGMNVFPMNYSTTVNDLSYKNIYVLSAYGDLEIQNLKLVKEIDFRHNYFVHCNRSEDAYFEMENHSEDIPFCKYIIIPNRYYKGIYRTYLYQFK